MLLIDSTEARRIREAQSKEDQGSCVVAVHLEALWSCSLWAIRQVAFQHLVKYSVRNSCCYTRASSFQKVCERVLGLRAKDPHAFETRDIRNEALSLVLEEAVPAWDRAVLLGLTFTEPFTRALNGHGRTRLSFQQGILTWTLPRFLHRGTCFKRPTGNR